MRAAMSPLTSLAWPNLLLGQVTEYQQNREGEQKEGKGAHLFPQITLLSELGSVFVNVGQRAEHCSLGSSG